MVKGVGGIRGGRSGGGTGRRGTETGVGGGGEHGRDRGGRISQVLSWADSSPTTR